MLVTTFALSLHFCVSPNFRKFYFLIILIDQKIGNFTFKLPMNMSKNQLKDPVIVTLMKSEEEWIEIGYFVQNIEHLKTEIPKQSFFKFWPQLFCSRSNIEGGLQNIYTDYSNLRDDMMFLGLHDDNETRNKENNEV